MSLVHFFFVRSESPLYKLSIYSGRQPTDLAFIFTLITHVHEETSDSVHYVPALIISHISFGDCTRGRFYGAVKPKTNICLVYCSLDALRV